MYDFNAKSKTTYDKIADGYDDSFDGKFTRKFKRLLSDNIDLEDNVNVLDVACGNGSLLTLLSEKRTIHGFGVDISEQMIKNAVANNPDMEFYVAGCEVIPIENDTMDLITVSAAYHHFPNVEAFAKEETQRTLSRNKDTTARLERAVKYAQEAEQNRRQMVANIAHELKTPLAIIHSYAEGLRERIAEDKRDKYSDIILSETERMNTMVLEMLDLSRLEA